MVVTRKQKKKKHKDTEAAGKENWSDGTMTIEKQKMVIAKLGNVKEMAVASQKNHTKKIARKNNACSE